MWANNMLTYQGLFRKKNPWILCCVHLTLVWNFSSVVFVAFMETFFCFLNKMSESRGLWIGNWTVSGVRSSKNRLDTETSKAFTLIHDKSVLLQDVGLWLEFSDQSIICFVIVLNDNCVPCICRVRSLAHIELPSLSTSCTLGYQLLHL